MPPLTTETNFNFSRLRFLRQPQEHTVGRNDFKVDSSQNVCGNLWHYEKHVQCAVMRLYMETDEVIAFTKSCYVKNDSTAAS